MVAQPPVYSVAGRLHPYAPWQALAQELEGGEAWLRQEQSADTGVSGEGERVKKMLKHFFELPAGDTVESPRTKRVPPRKLRGGAFPPCPLARLWTTRKVPTEMGRTREMSEGLYDLPTDHEPHRSLLYAGGRTPLHPCAGHGAR